VQFVGREIRVLDYIDGIGQEIGYYIAELCDIVHSGLLLRKCPQNAIQMVPREFPGLPPANDRDNRKREA
jgi:hypothetical protein